ncbi:MAG: DUF4381 domain-containing protein [Deltaproteobacteria bacterium]|nr:DUF4381 domain-containing protein [Deltaproteobacteria bacterium]
MNKTLPLDDAFGNPVIRGIEEIRQPDPVPWTPVAPGWICVGGILLLLGLWVLFRRFRRWRQNAYRREALSEITRLQKNKAENGHQVLRSLPGILKETALNAYPKVEVASLTGEKWLDFLERRCPGAGFKRETGRHLVTIAYHDPKSWSITDKEASEILVFVRRWIRRHHRRDPHA